MHQLCIYAALLICIAACGKSAWSPAQRSEYRAECVAKVSDRAKPYYEKYCDCLVEAGQVYSYEEFRSKDLYLLHRDSPEKLAACVKAMAP